MPSRWAGLNSWGVTSFKSSSHHYEVEKQVGHKTLPPLVNSYMHVEEKKDSSKL